MVSSSSVTVKPISDDKFKQDFGVIVTGIDVENLNGETPILARWDLGRIARTSEQYGSTPGIDADFDLIYNTLYRHSIVIITGNTKLSPRAQYELTRRFDPTCTNYGHGKTLDAKRSVLHPDLKTIPSQPQVQVIGSGLIHNYEGLENVQLRHPHHKTFHRDHIPLEDDLNFTRFYRWHIDAALYDLNPPRVTSLFAVSVPRGRRQTLRYDDGSGEELDVPLGTTAFVSGYEMYKRLSPEDQEFVRTSKIEYAAHPYIWMSNARSHPTGLGLFSEGRELSEKDLPPIEKDKIMVLPMLWRNPVTGDFALQIHPSAVRRIHLKSGSIIDDLEQVRKIIYRLQRPAISPKFIYAHDWQEGDLVLFNNHGVMHSVVGSFAQNEVRLFRQCNLAASAPPVGPDA